MARRFDLALLPSAPDFSFETSLWASGVERVAGVDEAGRGALAGPVAAGAVIFPPVAGLEAQLNGVRDSKQMTPKAREEWVRRLPELAMAWGVGFASAHEIDSIGIVPATRLAIGRALQALQTPPQHLLVDFLHLPEWNLPQTPLIKGDARSLSIAAASVLAKATRDALLREMDREYPGYGLALHKGYGTQAHFAAIERLGPASVHRRSFKLVKTPPEQEMDAVSERR